MQEMGLNQWVLGVVSIVQGFLIGLGEIWNYWIKDKKNFTM